MGIKRFEVGDTVKATWVHSGAAMADLHAFVENGSATMVSSATMVDSGNGHYYDFHTLPNSIGNYVMRMEGTNGGKTYKKSFRFRTVLGDTD